MRQRTHPQAHSRRTISRAPLTDVVRAVSPRFTVFLAIAAYAALLYLASSGLGWWPPRVPLVWSVDALLPMVELSGLGAVLVILALTRSSGAPGAHARRHLDPLTGLPNRAALEHAFSAAITSGQDSGSPVSVLLVDVDCLTFINDSLGYDLGDDVLVQVGTRLREHVREAGLVCRLAGKKFVVLAPRMDQGHATALAGSLCALFREPVELRNRVLVDVSVSVGIAVYPHHGSDPQSLLAGATDASREAKRIGKNSARALDRATLNRNREDLELQMELRGALAAEQFVVHYQPIVNVTTGRIEGAEALVRWAHPQRGMIRPDDFIGLAKQAGLMPLLGDWVIQEALTQAKRWIEYNARFRMSVNVSTSRLGDSGFARRLQTLLADSGVPPEQLVLELAAEHIAEDMGSPIAALSAVSRQGTGVALDNFGTGYSVMSYLTSLPLAALKLDQPLVNRATIDRRDRLVVEALIELAHGLGLQVVAVGVEAADQLALLRGAGCDLYQGYLYSAPLPAQAFHALLLRDRDAIVASGRQSARAESAGGPACSLGSR